MNRLGPRIDNYRKSINLSIIYRFVSSIKANLSIFIDNPYTDYRPGPSLMYDIGRWTRRIRAQFEATKDVKAPMTQRAYARGTP